MAIACPCRRHRVAAVVVLLASLSIVGCSSHERVETALARGAFANTPTALATPQYFVSPATANPRTTDPIVGDASNFTTPAKMTTASPSLAAVANDMKVMTFNLRVPFILDATNHWAFRKHNVIKTIEAAKPDVLGVQECVAEQADFLREQLSEYTFRGVGRGDGARQGEFAAVLYRSDKFKELDHGYFWLSTKPDVPGSKSWGAWSTRMCTWIKLQPLDGSPAFCMFNCHFEPISSRARDNSARLMHQRIESIASGMPVVVTGDFNADAGTKPYQLLLAGESLGVPQLLFDAFRVSHPKITGAEGTRHDFNGKRGGDRIDWILVNHGFAPISSTINHTRMLLGYPSDHFPVEAILRPTVVSAPLVARVD